MCHRSDDRTQRRRSRTLNETETVPGDGPVECRSELQKRGAQQVRWLIYNNASDTIPDCYALESTAAHPNLTNNTVLSRAYVGQLTGIHAVSGKQVANVVASCSNTPAISQAGIVQLNA